MDQTLQSQLSLKEIQQSLQQTTSCPPSNNNINIHNQSVSPINNLLPQIPAQSICITNLNHDQPNKTTVIDEEPKEQLISRGYYAFAKESADISVDCACLQGL